ncbi:MAG: peptidase S10 [Phycisphaerales bacterium]
MMCRVLTCLCAMALCPFALGQSDHADATGHAQHAHDTTTTPAIPLRSGSSQVRLDDRTLVYTWSAGTLPILDDETGEERAQMFHVAYRVESDTPRPVTFVFNGGPGSSSVWLHMGICGPKRIAFANDKGDPTPPPYDVVDNEHTWLAWTDLVFIDPISTGYSRPAGESEKSDFHGLEQDIASVGDFIRLWTTRNDAWGAPKFLCGESYGTTRAAGLSLYLQERHAMYLNGIVMVSSALDFGTLRFGDGNILPPALFLPTYAATAHYHGRLDEAYQRLSVDELMARVEAFVITTYTPALMMGDRLVGPERERVVDALSRFTGTSPAFIERHRLAPPIWRFTKELLRDQERSVGRLDSRFTGIESDPGSHAPEGDPSYDVILGPYSGAIHQHLRGELGIEDDRVYEILTGKVRPWDYGSEGNASYVNVAPHMREAMRMNKDLHVVFQSGLYDLATPYFATDHVISQLHLDPEIRDNVTHETYPAGHMMYLHLPTLARQSRDTRAFYERVLGED